MDAYAAARAAASGAATSTPKSRDGDVEMIRVLRVARRSAIKARTQSVNQLKSLIKTAPAELREHLRGLAAPELVARCARLRPGPLVHPLAACKMTLRHLARRIAMLDAEIVALDKQLDPIVKRAAPTLLGLNGVGLDSAAELPIAAGDNPERLANEAAFAHLCGVAPIPASSGKTTRHRLNRGGNRHANSALWRITMSRLRWDPRTQAYRARRASEQMSTREIIRCLKRYIAREAYRAILTDLGLQPTT